MYIQKSVGLGGINNRNDIYFVQELLNLMTIIEGRIPPLCQDRCRLS